MQQALRRQQKNKELTEILGKIKGVQVNKLLKFIQNNKELYARNNITSENFIRTVKEKYAQSATAEEEYALFGSNMKLEQLTKLYPKISNKEQIRKQILGKMTSLNNFNNLPNNLQKDPEFLQLKGRLTLNSNTSTVQQLLSIAEKNRPVNFQKKLSEKIQQTKTPLSKKQFKQIASMKPTNNKLKALVELGESEAGTFTLTAGGEPRPGYKAAMNFANMNLKLEVLSTVLGNRYPTVAKVVNSGGPGGTPYKNALKRSSPTEDEEGNQLVEENIQVGRPSGKIRTESGITYKQAVQRHSKQPISKFKTTTSEKPETLRNRPKSASRGVVEPGPTVS